MQVQLLRLCPRHLGWVAPCRMTRDHRVPRWLAERAQFLGIQKPDPMQNYQKMCEPCNKEKGGMIDYTDPYVREYMKKIVNAINAGLAPHS
jgi:hypothetical protein